MRIDLTENGLFKLAPIVSANGIRILIINFGLRNLIGANPNPNKIIRIYYIGKFG